MSKIIKFLFNTGSNLACTIISAIFTFFPEDFFNIVIVNKSWSKETNIIFMRLIVCIVIFFFSHVGCWLYYHKIRTKVSINRKNFSIQIEYGDLFQISKGKVVINFDECFTTQVGENPADIKPTSVCGQYLKRSLISNDNMKSLINEAGIKPEKRKSRYKSQDSYAPGTIVPNGNFLLMAFTKLDQNGLGHLTYDEYIDCLRKLWEQIDLWHGTDDVYLPILGSKIVRFDFDRDLTQQELLDIMINSYFLSPKKMKGSYTLHIVCRKQNGFSLNSVLGI